jgi:hypothetical protein
LEGEDHDVDPCDLGDGDGVGNGQRGIEDAIETNEALVEGNNTGDGLVLVETDLESLVVDDAVDVRGEMVQNLEGQVTEGLLGTLDPLARVGLGESNAQKLASRLELAIRLCLGDVYFGGLCESVEVLDALLEVGVVNTGLESEPVLDSACVCVEKV